MSIYVYQLAEGRYMRDTVFKSVIGSARAAQERAGPPPETALTCQSTTSTPSVHCEGV